MSPLEIRAAQAIGEALATSKFTMDQGLKTARGVIFQIGVLALAHSPLGCTETAFCEEIGDNAGDAVLEKAGEPETTLLDRPDYNNGNHQAAYQRLVAEGDILASHGRFHARYNWSMLWPSSANRSTPLLPLFESAKYGPKIWT